MCNLGKCVCVTFMVCFLSSLVTFQIWAEEALKQGAAAGDNSKSQKEEAISSGQPSLSFDAITYDAGEVWEGDVVAHDFVVKNTGTSELVIKSVKPG